MLSFYRLLLVLALGLIVGISPVMADSSYVVENVKVDVKADTALKARDEAFKQAQKTAFEKLNEALVVEGAVSKTATDQTISMLLQDFEVTNEKVSSGRYVGTYTFRFRDKAVQRFYGLSAPHQQDYNGQNDSFFSSENGLPFEQNSGQSVSTAHAEGGIFLVLPFEQLADKTQIWNPNNLWMEAWSRQSVRGGSFRLPIGDLNDVQDIADDQALTYDPSGMESLLARYNVRNGIVAIATPNSDLQQVTDGYQPSAGVLSIYVYRTNGGRPEYLDRITIQAAEGKTVAQMMDAGVRHTLTAIANAKPAKRTRTARQDYNGDSSTRSSASTLEMIVPISSLNDWQSVQKKIQRVIGVKGLQTKSLTLDQATVTLQYQGSVEQLAQYLAQSGFELRRIRSSGTMGRTQLYAPSVYILERGTSSSARINNSAAPPQNTTPFQYVSKR